MRAVYNQRFWSRYFKTYDIVLKVIPYQELLQTLIQSVKISPGDVILDAGSGTGNLALFLPPTVELSMLDQSGDALQIAKSKCSLGEIIQGSLLEILPFKNEVFDHIYCNNVLYTMPYTEWQSFLLECKRVLKPGGNLILSNLRSEFSVIAIYKDHIKKSFTKNGGYATVLELIRLTFPTLKMFRYNAVIKMSNRKGVYHFVNEGEQKKGLQQAGFYVNDTEKSVYADQAWMVVGKKKTC